MSKSVSAPVKLLLQKHGDKLAKREMTREEFVKAASELVSSNSRPAVGRNWGDQSKDTSLTKTKK